MVYSEYNKTILPSGLTIVSEKIPSVRSVSVGVWIKSGSRDEDKSVNGVAHFLEHMVFKGTEKRSPREIARSLESVGGNLNAFTSKEQTCYYAEVLDEHLPRAMDVLSDMVCHSTFPAKEMEKEREVILDEIDSVEDTPDDLVQEVFMEKLYPDSSLGYPILGSRQTVSGLTREQLVDFYARNYQPDNIVIAAAGNLDHNRLLELCANRFEFPPGQEKSFSTPPNHIGNGEYLLQKNVNQAHVCLGTEALPYYHHRKFELFLLNTVLGGGMSSRLFQNIRERYGVAYSIYSYVDFYRDNGLLGIYLGTEKKKVWRAVKLLGKELQRLVEKPVSQRELNQLKAQMKGGLVLGLESTSRRMSRLAKMEIYLQRFEDIDQVLYHVEQVTREGMQELAKGIFNKDRLLSVIFLPENGTPAKNSASE